jgi:hypothetical protein
VCGRGLRWTEPDGETFSRIAVGLLGRRGIDSQSEARVSVTESGLSGLVVAGNGEDRTQQLSGNVVVQGSQQGRPSPHGNRVADAIDDVELPSIGPESLLRVNASRHSAWCKRLHHAPALWLYF